MLLNKARRAAKILVVAMSRFKQSRWSKIRDIQSAHEKPKTSFRQQAWSTLQPGRPVWPKSMKLRRSSLRQSRCMTRQPRCMNKPLKTCWMSKREPLERADIRGLPLRSKTKKSWLWALTNYLRRTFARKNSFCSVRKTQIACMMCLISGRDWLPNGEPSKTKRCLRREWSAKRRRRTPV